MTDNQNSSGLGFVSTAITATPIISTSAFVAWQAFQDVDSQVSSAASAVASSKLNLNTVATSTFSSPISPDISKLEMNLQYIRDLSSSTLQRTPIGRHTDIAKQAWQLAIESESRLDQFTKDQFLAELNAVKSFEGLQRTIAIQGAHGNTRVSNSIFGTFKHNINAARSHWAQFDDLAKPANIGAIELSTPINNTTASIIPRDKLPAHLQPYLDKIDKSLGSAHIFETTNSVFVDRSSYSLQFPEKDISLELPITKDGTMLRGTTLKTRYIAPGVKIYDPKTKAITQSWNREEYLLHEFTNRIVPQVNNGTMNDVQLQRAVKDLQSHVFEELESVPNIPDVFPDAGGRAFQKLKSHEVQVLTEEQDWISKEGGYVTKYRPITSSEAVSLIETGRLKGGTSPSAIANGIYMDSGLDIRQWSMTPNEVDISRRPDQIIRNWEPVATPSNRFIINNELDKAEYSPKYIKDITGVRTKNIAPSLPTLYIDPVTHPQIIQDLGLTEGGGVMKNQAADLLAQQRIVELNLTRVNADAMQMIRDKRGSKLQVGTLLGYSDTGKAVSVEKNKKYLYSTTHVKEGAGNIATIFAQEKREMTRWEKFFGSVKAVIRRDSNKTLTKHINDLDIDKSPFLGARSQVIVSMDELRKNKSLHTQQMLTNMRNIAKHRQSNFDVNATNIANGRTTAMHELVSDIHGVARKFEQRATTNGITDHTALIKDLINYSRNELQLSKHEFGETFGAIPLVLGDDKFFQLADDVALTNQEFDAASEGIASGNVQLHYGNPKEYTGAGKMGSWEPRLSEHLHGAGFEDLGEEIRRELEHRVDVTEPSKKAVHQELTKTLASIEGRFTPGKDAQVWNIKSRDYSKRDFNNWLQSIGPEGGWIQHTEKIGKEQVAKHIYVPSQKTMIPLQDINTFEGNTIRNGINRSFHDVTRSIQHYSDKSAASHIDEILMPVLQAHSTPLGKGMGGMYRGKMLGSRFLTSVPAVGSSPKATRALNDLSQTFIIPHNQAKQMLNELEPFVKDATKFKAMRSRLLSGTETIAAINIRHPGINAFSSQIINIRSSKNITEPVAMIPAKMQQVKFKGFDAKDFMISNIINNAGDFDADTNAIVLVNPDLEQKMHKTIAPKLGTGLRESTYSIEQARNQLRQQLVKPQRAGSQLENVMADLKMAKDIKKLGIVQKWTPQISTVMSQAREAVLENLSGQSLSNAQLLITYLEQSPISSKHSSADKLEAHMSILSNIMRSSKTNDGHRLHELVNEMLNVNHGSMLEQAITKGLDIENIAEVESGFGVQIGEHLPGIDLKQTAENIMSSMRTRISEGSISISNQLAGRGAPFKIGNMSRYLDVLSQHGGNLIDDTANSYTKAVSGAEHSAGQLAKENLANAGKYAEKSASHLAESNILTALGKHISKHKVLLGAGVIGSTALMMALGSTNDTITPSSRPRRKLDTDESPSSRRPAQKSFKPQPEQHQQNNFKHNAPSVHSIPKSLGSKSILNQSMDMNVSRGKAASNLRPSDIMSPHPSGSPTVPQMMHQNSTRLSSMGRNMTIQSYGDTNINTDQLTTLMQRMTHGSTTVNLNNRSSYSSIDTLLAGNNLFN